MIRLPTMGALLCALSLIMFTGATSGFAAVAVADEPPPPATTPSPENGAGRRHNPAFAACKKQADDQKLAAGDARRDFMKNCMKSAQAAPPSA
jgi:psiF repeat-containing protein